jgi:hypothetical protein
MFFRRIFGNTIKTLAILQFLNNFLDLPWGLGDLKAERLTLNPLLCKTEQLSSTVAYRGD